MSAHLGGDRPMMWIAYDPSEQNHWKNRQQFNGESPAWGESQEEFDSEQDVDVPQVGDTLVLRMGWRVVESRRLCEPETDEAGTLLTGYYWTIIVR